MENTAFVVSEKLTNQQVAREFIAEDFREDESIYLLLKAMEHLPEIEFNHLWSNGLGYLDGAIIGDAAPKLLFKTALQCWTPGGRPIMLVGTRLGTVAIFARFDNWHASDSPAVTFSATTAIKQVFNLNDPALNYDNTQLLVGDAVSRNIGHRVEDCFTLCKRAQRL